MSNLFYKQGKFDDAIALFRKVLRLKPDHVEAHNNMGNALYEQGKVSDSIASYRKALKLNLDYAEAYNNVCNALQEQGKLNDAIASYRKALTVKPGYAEAHNDMGSALLEQDRVGDSVASYRRALQLNPDLAEAHYNMGLAFNVQGKVDDAIASYNKALEIDPEYVDAYFNQSLVYLLKEDFKNFWPQYQWRWKSASFNDIPLQSRKPAWKFPDKKKVLLWSEQGLGDEIMFSSMFSELHAKTKKLIVQLDERLVSLFSRSFPKDVIYYSKREGSENLYDAHIPMGSLPMHF